MTGARYHLLALVAAIAALATGVIVGAGPLAASGQDRVEGNSAALRSEQTSLRRQVADLRAEVASGGIFATEVTGPAIAGRLAGRTVVVLGLPGANAATVRDAAAGLAKAGATVVLTLNLKASYFDAAQAASPLEDLALRLVPPGVTFPQGATPIDRVSTVLARAVVGAAPGDLAAVDQPGAEVLAGLADLGALRTGGGEPGHRADTALVVAPDGAIGVGGGSGGSGGSAATVKVAAAERAAVAGLVGALDRGSLGAVVIGPTASAVGRGVLAGLRSGPATGASTVDVADPATGPALVVLALAGQVQGRAGDYGLAKGATRLVPEVAAPPG